MPSYRPALAHALAAVALVPAATAVAADLGGRRPLDGSYRDSGYPAPLAYAKPNIWTGLYVGIDGGGGIGSLGSSMLVDGDVSLGGGTFGGHIGYNIQMGSFVAGLEVDGGWAGISGDRAFSATNVAGNIGWLSSTRGRLGYAWDNWLVYATGGLGLAGLDVTTSNIGASATMSETLVGYVIGGGVEMKLSSSISARLEALHYGFGETTLQSPQGSLRIDPDVTTVRAGVSYHWN